MNGFVLALVLLVTLCSAARVPFLRDTEDETRSFLKQRDISELHEIQMDGSIWKRSEPSICPHCASLGPGCYCNYRNNYCLAWGCGTSGQCDDNNCIQS